MSVFQFPGQATKEATYQALAAQKALLQRGKLHHSPGSMMQPRSRCCECLKIPWRITSSSDEIGRELEIRYVASQLSIYWHDADGVELADPSAFSVAQYDPVHSLRERTNEVWLSVKL